MHNFILQFPANATNEQLQTGPSIIAEINRQLDAGEIRSPLDADVPPGYSVQVTQTKHSGKPKPSVGRIVHYTAYNGTCLAMLITAVDPDKPGQVHGVVFTALPNFNGELSGGVQTHFNVPCSHSPFSGTWHWPERED